MKKRVILFNSPIIKEKVDVFEMENLFPRIGIASIAAALLKNNIETIIIDPQIMSLHSVKNKIRKFDPDIVGIPAYTSEIFAAAETASLVKRINDDILTVVGGPHCSAISIETLKEFSSFDIAVVGEGEYTILDIALGKNLKKIDGIVYRNNGEIIPNKRRKLVSNLDSLPFPAWDLYDLDKYRGGSLMSGFDKKGKSLDLPIEGARGCPFDCVFCYRVNSRIIRFKDSKRIVDEAERNVEEFGASTIFFVEGTFGVNKKIAMDMCNEIIKRGLKKKIAWSTGGRVNVLDKELLTKMKEAGCIFLGIGVESGNQDILNSANKGTSLSQIMNVFDWCKKLGIKTEANFVIGLPYDTKSTVLDTIKFAQKLNTDYANFAILVPFPGTKIVEMANKHMGGVKILTRDWRLYGKQIGAALELEQLPHEELIKLQTLAYIRFYLKPHRFLRFVNRLSLKKFLYGAKRILNLRNKVLLEK